MSPVCGFFFRHCSFPSSSFNPDQFAWCHDSRMGLYCCPWCNARRKARKYRSQTAAFRLKIPKCSPLDISRSLIRKIWSSLSWYSRNAKRLSIHSKTRPSKLYGPSPMISLVWLQSSTLFRTRNKSIHNNSSYGVDIDLPRGSFVKSDISYIL